MFCREITLLWNDHDRESLLGGSPQVNCYLNGEGVIPRNRWRTRECAFGRDRLHKVRWLEEFNRCWRTRWVVLLQTFGNGLLLANVHTCRRG